VARADWLRSPYLDEPAPARSEGYGPFRYSASPPDSSRLRCRSSRERRVDLVACGLGAEERSDPSFFSNRRRRTRTVTSRHDPLPSIAFSIFAPAGSVGYFCLVGVPQFQRVGGVLDPPARGTDLSARTDRNRRRPRDRRQAAVHVGDPIKAIARRERRLMAPKPPQSQSLILDEALAESGFDRSPPLGILPHRSIARSAVRVGHLIDRLATSCAAAADRVPPSDWNP
jgi:hypothetical protein